ncbi:MAG: PBP1A family penicillin-binding protein [Thermodesulfobacteriota bacterium]
MSAKKKKPLSIRLQWNQNHLGLFFISMAMLLTGLIAALLFAFVALDIPAINSLTSYQPPQTTIIKDRYGHIIDRIYLENRMVVDLGAMPELLPKAFVAAEDARFFDHVGVDSISVLRAIINNVRRGGRGQGGSTITQQVARSLLLTREKTYLRKIKEAILAYRIDKVLSKEEILHIYLNQIYLGEKAHGVGAAAQTYFGKEANELNLAEMSLLAGLPQAPSRYSPFRNYAAAKKRQRYVLNRMAAEGYISSSAARKTFDQPLLWAPRRQDFVQARYFLQYVRNHLFRRYGRAQVETAGFTVETTLDPAFQREAALAVEKGVASWALRSGKGRRRPPQAALVTIENSSGKVRALTGGVHFYQSQFNRAYQARRQPGSAFKPLVFAQAFSTSFSPASIINDEPLKILGPRKQNTWRPRNFSGHYFGPTTLSTALVKSRNVVAIKLLQKVGIDNVINLAQEMGINSNLHPNLSLALGASEVSLLELTSAYTVFAAAGRYHEPIFINRILNQHGQVMEAQQPQAKQVLDPRAAFQVTRMLQDVIRQGTGKMAGGLPGHSAGKTGTTDSNMDAWFVGYTPELSTGVWMGFDLKKPLGQKETGGKACAPIWLDYMRHVTAGVQPSTFAVPPGIVFQPIDRKSGGLDPSQRDRNRWLPFWASRWAEISRRDKIMAAKDHGSFGLNN